EKSQTIGQAGGHENNMKAEGREGRESNKAAESKSEKGNKAAETKGEKSQTTGQASGRENNMKPEGRENNMGRQGNEMNKSTTEKSQTTGQAGAAAKLSTEQRTKITSVIRNEHVSSVKNVNFSVSVGTRVPREGIEFHTLPTEVVSIYPEWRGYKFIVVRDEIVIIDPNTYEIVEIIT